MSQARRPGAWIRVRWLALLPACAAPAAACAQSTGPAATSRPTLPYADYTFGFEMRIPAGWNYDRTRFVGPDGGVGLLRGGAPATRSTLQVLVFPKAQSLSFGEWIREFESKLAGISGTRKIQGRQRRLGARSAAVLEVDARLGADHTRTYYLCVPFDPTKVWVLSYATLTQPGQANEHGRRQFERLAASVRVLYDLAQARELTAAFARGQKLIQRLATAAARLRLPGGQRYYEITVAGKPIGFLERRIARENRSLDDPRYGKQGKPGVHVHEQSWRFAADGSVRYTQIDLFASFDLQTELNEVRTTQVPAPTASAQRLFITLDQCVRQGDLLFSSYSTSLDAGLPNPREPIQVGRTYLSLAFVRLLPGLLGAAPATPYAFAVYDPKTRALSTTTIRALGQRPLPGDPARRAAAFETRQGFAEQRDMLYTDRQGRLLCYRAGDLLLKLTSRQAVRRRYGSRRDAALKRMQGQAP